MNFVVFYKTRVTDIIADVLSRQPNMIHGQKPRVTWRSTRITTTSEQLDHARFELRGNV